jgi:hypothetical protein
MKMLLVYSLFSSALAVTTSAIIGGTCTLSSDHPENGGYHIIGVGGYKAVTAAEDQDDKSTYGVSGQLADEYLWTSDQTAVTYQAFQALPSPCAKGLQTDRYGNTEPCGSEMEHHEWKMVTTCAILRFSWPTTDSDSTVYMLTGNDTFQNCDFTGATQITDGGVLPSGSNFVDKVFESTDIDEKFYFASQIGCEQGQKIAVAVTEPYADSYAKAYLDGQWTTRIRACDCDHEI